LSYLERQLGLALSHGLTNRAIELSLLEAQARQAEGDNKRAWSALDRAISAAEPEGYVRIFDQGPALNQLLAEAAQHDFHREFIERILAVIRIESNFSFRYMMKPPTGTAGFGRTAQRARIGNSALDGWWGDEPGDCGATCDHRRDG
jgi:LuxR family maltose regulon positive regulatory protein